MPRQVMNSPSVIIPSPSPSTSANASLIVSSSSTKPSLASISAACAFLTVLGTLAMASALARGSRRWSTSSMSSLLGRMARDLTVSMCSLLERALRRSAAVVTARALASFFAASAEKRKWIVGILAEGRSATSVRRMNSMKPLSSIEASLEGICMSLTIWLRSSSGTGKPRDSMKWERSLILRRSCLWSDVSVAGSWLRSKMSV
mmetsp:Transcript_2660/g.5562  ORF Transcript_2660/g.5562 Transcript_2660/m.5562 type:complete len:204 (+) Transcript_2660:1157-1768(+)